MGTRHLAGGVDADQLRGLEKAGKLSEGSAKLAARYVPLARKLAKPFKESYPQDPGEFESEALLALCKAARDYDKARSVGFARYARPRIVGACLDVLRARPGMDALPDDGSGRPVFASQTSDPERAVDLADEAAAALDQLPPDHAAVMSAIHIEGRTHRELPAAVGLSNRRVNDVRRESLGYLKKAK